MKYIYVIVLWWCCSVSAFAGIDTARNNAKKLQSIVFIAGFDEGNNMYYTNAKNYFSNQHYQVIEEVQSLGEILNWLRLHYDTTLYGDIHIVSHSNPWRGLSMKTSSKGTRITEITLKEAICEGEIIPLAETTLPNETRIIFHACGLGKNKALLVSLKQAITQNNTIAVYASEYFNVFGGKYAAHYMAKTYYGYYPTAYSPGPRALAAEFRENYPTIQTDWENVLKTRTEQLHGDMYTYRFNIPITWEFEFEDKADIPNFTNTQQIIDWIAEDENLHSIIKSFHIPIEKFRWLTKVHGNTLIINGKTTVLCVLKPLMKLNKVDEYLPITINEHIYTKV